MLGLDAESNEAFHDSNNLVQDTVTNMRTVTSFGNENNFICFFNDLLKLPESLIVRKSNIVGFYSSVGYFVLYFNQAVIFYYAAVLNRDEGLSMRNIFIVLLAIFYANICVLRNLVLISDISRAN
jgi:ABC-type multidrug transport system fused ATPase/permease subunit